MTAYGVALLAGCLVLAAQGGAQDRSRAQVTGSLRAGYWSSTRNLDGREPLGAGMLWLRGSAPVGRARFFAEGWAVLRGPPDASEAASELREAFLAVSFGDMDLRLGRQIVAWGRADGVNPTGNLAAEDMTLLTPDDVDRRLGATMASVSYYHGDLSLSALWLPEFRGHRVPLPPAGGASLDAERRQWPGDQWALRAERTGGAVDWSLSVFRGLDLAPDLTPTASADRIALRHHRLLVAGADVATNLGRYALRAEAAYVSTEDESGADPFTKNPFAFLVVGGDRTFDGRYNLNLQYLVRRVAHFHAPGEREPPELGALAAQQAVLSSQVRRWQHGATIRASGKWLQETLELEWASVAWVAPRGVAMRPKVMYSASDHLTVLAGAEVFRGASTSLFHLLRPNTVAYVEMRWGF